MELMEAIETRHSVRAFTQQRIEGEVQDELRRAIDECNRESGLNIQLVTDEPTAFSGMMARYGKFSNANNYIALVGQKSPGLEEKCGYYGEKIVLKAQMLGLRSCWAAISYSKGKSRGFIKTAPGEKTVIVIALGYGQSDGVPHKSKPLAELYTASGPLPAWFQSGMQAAQLAPTAMNQQKFRFALEGGRVATGTASGFYTKIDLGIAKYHFEAGAGPDGWQWA